MECRAASHYQVERNFNVKMKTFLARTHSPVPCAEVILLTFASVNVNFPAVINSHRF